MADGSVGVEEAVKRAKEVKPKTVLRIYYLMRVIVCNMVTLLVNSRFSGVVLILSTILAPVKGTTTNWALFRVMKWAFTIVGYEEMKYVAALTLVRI